MNNVNGSAQQQTWSQVDNYLNTLLIPSDSLLEQALRTNAEAGLPAHDVAPNQGKLLQLLLQIQGATRVLDAWRIQYDLDGQSHSRPRTYRHTGSRATPCRDGTNQPHACRTYAQG